MFWAILIGAVVIWIAVAAVFPPPVVYGLLALIFTPAICFAIFYNPQERSESDQILSQEVLPLKSLSSEGGFYLGSRIIDSEPSYSYYAEQEDGSYNLFTVPASSAKIFEVKGTSPQVTIITREEPNTPFSFGGSSREYLTYEFLVPEGSVKDNFDLVP